MKTQIGTLNFASLFLKKIRVISIISCLLIGITPPLVYLVLDLRHERGYYERYAQSFALNIQQAIRENPDYWQLNVEKFMEVFSNIDSHDDVRSIAVYDSDMRLIYSVKIKDRAFLELPGKTQVFYGNKPAGQVVVTGGPGGILVKFAFLLVMFSLIGLLLSRYLYKYSALTAQQYEQEMMRLFGTISATNQKLAGLNGELGNEIAERNQIERVLKMSEEELVQKNIQLATALEDIVLAQATLIQQEKMAGIGQLAAGVAHEINNPLGFVMSNVEALEQYFQVFNILFDQYQPLITDIVALKDSQTVVKADQIVQLEKDNKLEYILADIPEIFRDTNEGLDRMNKIVKGMGIFSRVDQQQLFELYDLNKGLENTLLVTHNEIKYNATVEREFGHIPEIEAIGSEVNQVLLNLVFNASHAIKEKYKGKQGKIKLKTWCDEQFVYCAIEDDGAGILASNLNNIFNPFFTTKPVGQGTGMGLSISYKIIVYRHHGEIMVESCHGEGTKFIVKLPIKHDLLKSIKNSGV